MNRSHEPRDIVIVGASLAGLRGAEALRAAGYSGRLTIVGDEPHRPYDRPPLSKHVLVGDLAADSTELPSLVPLGARWRLGHAAVVLDRKARAVRLADGSTLTYDRLLIATGARARPWPAATGGTLGGIFTLRSRNDAAALRAAIKRGPRRVLIVGAGLIGSEAASSCHDLGLSVTLVDPHPTPLARAIGTVMGEILVDRLAEAGIDFRPGFHVRSFEGGAGHIRRAYLSNGRAVETDCVIVALGATRDTSWLADAGLLANGNGITCDGACRALDSDGTPIRDIYVAGDAARWPSSIYDNRLISVEHWGNAVEQAAHAARNMLTPDEEQASYQHLPAYWSSQFGTNIKVVGLPPGADKVAVVQGSRESRRLLAAYGKAGRTIAAVSFDEARWLPAYAERIVSRHPFPPISGASDQPPFAELAPGFPAQFGQELLEQKSSKL